ncbi:MAG: hypothetical protein JW709_00400 [Sedimentisphaerales bacterium]|nr:hypothetical protein [Sedimentisphaerales bacterium]
MANWSSCAAVNSNYPKGTTSLPSLRKHSSLQNKREPWTPLLCSYPSSEKINAVSFHAETLFTRLLAQCDDNGNFDGQPVRLLCKLYDRRFERGELTAEDVLHWRDELIEVGLVILYRGEPEGPELLHIVNCKKHLRSDIRADIRFPDYASGDARDASGTATGRVRNESGTHPGRGTPRPRPESGTGPGRGPSPSRPETGTDPGRGPGDRRDVDDGNGGTATTTTATTTTTPTENLCTERNPSAPCSSTIEFDFSTRQFLQITDADRAAWARAYPAVNLDAELCRAGEWLLANPRKRKKNIRRFLGNWLSRCQERGGSRGGNRSPPAPTSRLRSPCRVCGAKASKHIDGQGSFCPLHGPQDVETNPQPPGASP